MNHPSSSVLFAILGAIFIALALPAPARPGDPDIRFGPNSFGNAAGTVVTPFPPPDANWPVAALAVQGDGKIVAAGAFTDFYLARFLDNGTPDPGFGTGGRVKTPQIYGPGSYSFVHKTIVQPDGRILVGATIAELSIVTGTSQLLVMRHLSDGTREPSFGIDGKIVLGNAGEWITGADLALQSDGKILAMGNFFPDTTVLFRLQPNGGMDNGFGAAGLTRIPGAKADRMALLPDGKILMGGTVRINDRFTLRLTRCDAAGQLDTAFGSGGILTVPNPQGMEMVFADIAIQSDGKILVGGTANIINPDPAPGDRSFMLSRFHPDGSPDTSFNGTGRALTDVTPVPVIFNDDRIGALAVQSDGKILIAGHADNVFKIIRHLPDGTLDPGFGSGGVASTGAGSYLYAMALQPDGKIVTGGGRSTPNGGAGPTAMARTLGRQQVPGFTAEWPPGTPLTYGRAVDLGSVVKRTQRPLETTLTLRNSGDAPVTGITAAFSQADAQRFSFVSPVPAVIDAHNSVSVRVQFAPPPEAGTFSAILTVTSGNPDWDGLVFTVHATSVEPVAELSVFDGASPLKPGATLDFGPGVPGVGITRILTAKNTGNFDLVLQSNLLGQEGTPGDFTVGAPGEDVLAPGASTSFPVTFTLLGPGLRTASLRVVTTDTLKPPLEIRLQGTMAPGREAWRTAWFSTNVNEGPGADFSDPDGDGLPNLVEYAFGLSPVDRLSSALPEFKYTGQTFSGFLTATFTAPAWTTDILYSAEWSFDMQPGQWQVVPDTGTAGAHLFITSPSSKRVFVRFVVKVR